MTAVHADHQLRNSHAQAIYNEQMLSIAKRTDKLVAVLMVVQWVAAILAAFIISPRAWEGSQSFAHPHIFWAVWLGGLFTIVPVYFAYAYNGSVITRHVMAIAQMLMSGLLIHISGGRIETHFHVFGSLAILAFYRDWRVLISATLVVALDHLLRGLLAPFSIYGVQDPTLWRTLEHALWVVFEDIFLAISCVQNANDVWINATKQSELEGTAELKTTLAQLAETRQRLTEQAGEIGRCVRMLNESGGYISEALIELSSNAQQTLAAVTQASSVAEMVRQTAEVSSHRARNVAKDSQEVLRISERGQAATDQTVTGMKNIRGQMSAIAESMSSLGQQSKLIGEIISTVDDFSQQSNLLAVNASIEAAKAAEYGKGFAVVALEVKSLASGSKDATANVRKILNDILNATISATMSAELGTKAVSAGEDVVVQARDSIVTLAESVRQAAIASTQIETASRQQLVDMEQVVVAMESVKEASNQNVRSVRQLDQAVHSLNDLGRQLKALVDSTARLAN